MSYDASIDHDFNDFNKKNKRLGITMLFVAVGMVGLSFASVPLYDWFCRVTGFAGTTQRADSNVVVETNHPAALTRNFNIRFDANIDNDLPWNFDNLTQPFDVKVGAFHEARYMAENLSDKANFGVSSFNVTPLKVGKYFVKIDCFCFTEQELKSGEYREMPLQFYVDPAILEDENMDDVNTITISYHFYGRDK